MSRILPDADFGSTRERPAARFRGPAAVVPAEAAVSEQNRVHEAIYLKIAVLTIVAWVVLQTLFLCVGCDWDLCGDEAEYWAWSRRLDWSYYAKGPLIAFLIRGAVELFGPLSRALTGDLMPAIRFPAVLLSAWTAWGVFRLGERTLGSRRAALIAMLVVPAVPMFRLGGLLMTIDTPLLACWTWAAVWCFEALERDDAKRWLGAGVLAALGVLAKYSMLAFPASVGLYLLLDRKRRRQLIQPGFWLMSVFCLAGMAPIVYWNMHNGWVAAEQMANRVGLAESGGRLRAINVLGFFGSEAAVWGGYWWVVAIAAVAGAIKVVRPRRRSGVENTGEAATTTPAQRSGLMYLLCLWGTIWSACLGASFLGESMPNWAAPGYAAVLVLIGRRVDLAWDRGGRPPGRYVYPWAALMLGLTLFQHTEWLYPAIARFVPEPTRQDPMPMKRWDPSNRMRGHKAVAAEVDKTIEALRSRGIEPFVVSPNYAATSLASFYLRGQPETYCIAWSKTNPDATVVNQHDLWRPNPRRDPEAFRGRTAVFVEESSEPIFTIAHILSRRGLFGVEESTRRVYVRDGGVVAGSWDITVCRDFKGLDAMYMGVIGIDRSNPEKFELIFPPDAFTKQRRRGAWGAR